MLKQIIGGAAFAGVAIFGGVTAMGDETKRDDSGMITESGGLGAYAIRLGDCMQLPDEDLLTSVEGVPCTSPHDGQAYALFDMPDGEFPGANVVDDAILEGCLERFEGFVGTPYDESVLDFTALFPTPESWAQDDREIVCLLIAEEPLSIDAANSGL